MKTKPWFVLPAIQEWYFKSKNPTYQSAPKFLPECESNRSENMAVIYPKNRSGIFIPRGLDGLLEKVVFEIAHRQPESKVFWHLDNQFIGSTQTEHNLELAASAGNHTVTVIDEHGEQVNWIFEALEK